MPPPKCRSEKGYICNCDRYSMKLLLRLIWPHRVYCMELSQGTIIYKPNKQELSSMFITYPLNVMHASVNFHKYIPYGLGVMAHTQFTIWN